MSSDTAFRNQFEKLIKEHGWSMKEFRENLVKGGDGYAERFEKICGILLIAPPNLTNKDKLEWIKKEMGLRAYENSITK